MQRLTLAAIGVWFGSGLAAQEQDPLSAIDWLSRSVAAPAIVAQPQPIDEPPVSETGAAPEVTTSALGEVSADNVGLLSPDITGLPRDLWTASEQDTLIPLIQALNVETLPAMQDLLMTLLLAEARPPAGADNRSLLFVARIDKLLDLGALEPAQAMIEAAGPESPHLYRRWFDISLLTGSEDRACEVLRSQPGLAPTDPARIFCLARNGDWRAAALTLNTSRLLGGVTEEELTLLSRFLDPELFEEAPAMGPPSRPSPLVFRMREAIGEDLPTATLPRAFAHADLRSTVAWRYQMQAAERLIRTGAVADNVLLGHYTRRRPAASGGVWDRAAAIQAFDGAIARQDAPTISATLPAAWEVAQFIHGEVAFARLYDQALAGTALDEEAAQLAYRIGLLGPDYEEVARSSNPATPSDQILQAIAIGTIEGLTGETRLQSAVLAGFTNSELPPPMATIIAENRTGEALLRTISLFEQGLAGDTAALTDALRILRHMGLDDTARRTALQALILDRAS